MFEESLVASQVRSVSTTKRWTMLGSTALQVAIAATLIVIPLLHPERLTLHLQTPLVFTPPPPRPPLPVAQPEPSGSARAATTPLPPVTIRSQIPSFISRTSSNTSPAITNISNSWGMGTAVIGDMFSSTANHGTAVSAAPAKPPTKPVPVSSGVIAGMLITPIRPIYPAIARAAHVSGSIVVEAVISKAGTIESLHAISGPEMLRAAALDAIRPARYKPFLLNGIPTEVQTTITVNFTMGG
ncbi:MAG TPA: energy transducer TonB [Edaphobacter sp.]